MSPILNPEHLRVQERVEVGREQQQSTHADKYQADCDDAVNAAEVRQMRVFSRRHPCSLQ